MKTKINYLFALATLTTLGISFNAVAVEKPQINSVSLTTEMAQNPPATRQRREGRKNQLMEKLNLTTQQQQQIESIRTKYEPEMNNIKEQMRVERQKMNEMMKNNDSQNNLRSQHQKITALQQKMNNLRFESMLETREILTPQQRQQFSENMDGRRGDWKGKVK